MKSTSAIEVPLGNTAHEQAGQLAVEYDDPAQSKQAYLNALSVYAVHRYLQWFEIMSSLEVSDSWNPGLRGNRNIADLVIPKLGRLECRPILPGTLMLEIPEEATESEELIACLGVQLDENLEYAYLIGFTRTVEQANIANSFSSSKLPKCLAIDELEDLENFFGYLNYIQEEFRNVSEMKALASPNNSLKNTSNPDSISHHDKKHRSTSKLRWLESSDFQSVRAQGYRKVPNLNLLSLIQKHNIPQDSPEVKAKVKLNGSEISVNIISWPSSLEDADSKCMKWNSLFRISREELVLPKGLEVKVFSGKTFQMLNHETVNDQKKELNLITSTVADEILIVRLEYRGRVWSLPQITFDS